MTYLAADIAKLAIWGETVEREIEETQALARLPMEQRTHPLLSLRDIVQVSGTEAWQWHRYVSKLPPEERPATSAGGQFRASLEQVHRYMDAIGARPSRPAAVPRAMRIAVENFKGGAGKSSTALHLGVSLARRGYRVLLVDCDPQASLTRMLGLQPAAITAAETVAAAVGSAGRDPTSLRPRETYVDGLSIIPACLGLSDVEVEILRRFTTGQTAGIEQIFDTALAEIDRDYDLVICDFQPAFSATQLLLLWAMDGLVIPVPTETADLAGTGDFLHQVAQFMSPMVSITGRAKVWDPTLVVSTRRRKGTDLSESMASAVFGQHRIPEAVDDVPAVSASLAMFRSVYESGANNYDRRALKRAKEQYEAVVDRVISAIEARWAEMVQEIEG